MRGMSNALANRAVLVGASLALLAGCGGELERAPIFGTITGVTGRDGTITMMPADNHEGPSGTAQIINGEFKFDADSGPGPGPYMARVRLAAPVRAGAQVAASDPAKQPDKIPTRATFGRDPFLPVAEERVIPVVVPKQAPWKLDIPWK